MGQVMTQSNKVFSGLITCSSILHRHKLGLDIAFVISMVILLVPPLSCPHPPPITSYIPVLPLSPPLFSIFSLPLFPALSVLLLILTLYLPLSFPLCYPSPSLSLLPALETVLSEQCKR